MQVIRYMPVWISVTVSRRPSRQLHHHFWREIRTIKVLQCPPHYNPWREANNTNPYPKLKINWTQTLALKLQTGGLRIDLAGHLVTFTKTERVAKVHPWIKYINETHACALEAVVGITCMHICWTAWRAAILSSHITLLCRLFRIPIKHKRSGNSMNMALFSKTRFVKRCTIVGSTWWLTCFTDSWAFKTLFSVDSARRWASSLETKMMTFNFFFRSGEIVKYGLACPLVRAKRCRPLVAFRLKPWPRFLKSRLNYPLIKS